MAILPPGRAGCVGICPKPPDNSGTTKVDLALAFDHSELQPWLDRPLRMALPEALPPTVSQMESAPEAELVSVITAHGLFQEHQEAAQDGGSVVLLSPGRPLRADRLRGAASWSVYPGRSSQPGQRTTGRRG